MRNCYLPACRNSAVISTSKSWKFLNLYDGVNISRPYTRYITCCPLSCTFIHIHMLYVAMQYFKISKSEYLRCASKCAISKFKKSKIFWGGAQPPPQTLPRRLPARGHPLSAPHPFGAFGASVRDPVQTKILPTPLLRPAVKAFTNGSGDYPQ